MDKLPDTWSSRDFPVLLAAARRIEAGESFVHEGAIASDVGIERADALMALAALEGIHLTGRGNRGDNQLLSFVVQGITERGRRAVGLWPGDETADALVQALEAAAEAETDPAEQGRLRKAAKAVRKVSRDVLVEVTGAVVTRLMMGGAG